MNNPSQCLAAGCEPWLKTHSSLDSQRIANYTYRVRPFEDNITHYMYWEHFVQVTLETKAKHSTLGVAHKEVLILGIIGTLT